MWAKDSSYELEFCDPNNGDCCYRTYKFQIRNYRYSANTSKSINIRYSLYPSLSFNRKANLLINYDFGEFYLEDAFLSSLSPFLIQMKLFNITYDDVYLI